MELALSLGDAPKSFSFFNKTSKINNDLGFTIGLGIGTAFSATYEEKMEAVNGSKASDPPFQLLLLPSAPLHPQIRLPWLSDHLISEPGFSDGSGKPLDDRAAVSSPTSGVSSFPVEFSGWNGGSGGRTSSRVSDEEENGLSRKKLRLSKDQSAFLEESFKQHSTLNPKQKLGLAKQLNLRPRQVEVWFQNRRARTKLKQTEVDCEYLKKCCEKLTEENRKLENELKELRALKTSHHPFCLQLPATTLTMCPACERTTTSSASAATTSISAVSNAGALCLGKSLTLQPFSHHTHQAAS